MLSSTVAKLIKTDFSVRCGVNAGFVYFDETTPLETMTDRVIDVAGHMQKYADPNTVAVAQNIVEPLNDRAGFAPAKRVVDGYILGGQRTDLAQDCGARRRKSKEYSRSRIWTMRGRSFGMSLSLPARSGMRWR